MQLEFNLQDLDSASRENFEILKDQMAGEALLNARFKFLEISFPVAGTYLVAHGLGFTPKDVIMTAKTNSTTVTWNTDSFTSTDLSVTISAPTIVRVFVGAYEENT